MFSSISRSLTKLIQDWKGDRSSQKIDAFLKDVREALIEADTAVSVADLFIQELRQPLLNLPDAQGIPFQQKLQAAVHETLVRMLGRPPETPLAPHGTLDIILLVGLQGAGKTTTSAKLARWIEEHRKRTVALTSLDFQRPAAIAQLKTLAEQNKLIYLEAQKEAAKKMAEDLIHAAKQAHAQTLIVDTAGRLDMDAALMAELSELKKHLQPQEILLVLDAQLGQRAASMAQNFQQALQCTGLILSKCDADSKGGAALSARSLSGCPILFMGVGEKTQHLEIFDPERIANRMLDLGDIAQLVSKLKNADIQAHSKKLLSGSGATFEDILQWMMQMDAMGGLSSLVAMLPGAQNLPQGLIDPKRMAGSKALILSMTPKERRHPNLLSVIHAPKTAPKRIERICKGSGRNKEELSQLIKMLKMMSEMIAKLKNPHIRAMMDQMLKMQGQ